MPRDRIRFSQVTLMVLAFVLLYPCHGAYDGKAVAAGVSALPSFADLAEAVNPGVVNINAVSIVVFPGNPFQFFLGQGSRGRDRSQFEDYIRSFFGDIPDRELKRKSVGSGFLIDKAGYIATNYHVVRRAEEITVRMADGREFKAVVIGRDVKTDLSLIKIPSTGEDLPALPLGDSDSMRVGDWVLAIGNPFGLAHTVTQGIISATGRVIGVGPYDSFLQTDAPVNPGSSGGPLVNMKGEVIGITTAIVAEGRGLGFAIPSAMAKQIITQLREKGRVVRGWIGVSIQEMTPDLAHSLGMKEAKGAFVGGTTPGGPAETAGVRSGDIVVRFDGQPIKTSSDLTSLVAQAPVNGRVPITVFREDRQIDLKVRITELSEEQEEE